MKFYFNLIELNIFHHRFWYLYKYFWKTWNADTDKKFDKTSSRKI